jgi:hypothetical protein
MILSQIAITIDAAGTKYTQRPSIKKLKMKKIMAVMKYTIKVVNIF